MPLVIDDLPRRDLRGIPDCGQSRTTVALKSALDAPTAPNAVVIGGVEKKINIALAHDLEAGPVERERLPSVT
jgi:hypothetical protein